MIGAAAKILGSTLTRYVGGVIINAALSGSNQQNRKDTQGLEDSTPGTLSQSAVSTETGGMIFDKVLGKPTPKGKPTKLEVPEPAKVPEQKVDSNKELEKAAADLLNDPDSLSVSDAELKNHVVKIFGGGILPLLIRTEAKAVDAANNVRALNQNLLNTQSVFVDQNNILASKLDQILDIFGDQLEYQKQVKDQAQAQRRLDKLAQKQDESSVRAFLATTDSKKKGQILSNMMDGLGAAKLINKLQGLEKLGKSTRDIISSIGKFKTAALIDPEGKAVGEFLNTQARKADVLGRRADAKKAREARRVAEAAEKAAKKKAKEASLRKLADALGIEKISDLYGELKMGGIGALEDMYESGFITPGEMSEFRDAARKIGLDVSDLPDPVPNWEKPPTGELKPTRQNVPTLEEGKVKKKPLNPKKLNAAKVNPKQATAAVDKMLQTPKGAAKIMKPKGLAKGFGKLIPGIGAAIALGEAAYRFGEGDVAGGIMSIGSAIPILGWGFVAADIARDFGFDPLNTLPKDQYETGTGLTKPGTAILHGTEAVIGQNEQEDLLGSYRESIDLIGSNLVSVSVALGDATGDSSAINSIIKKSGLTYDIVPMSLSTDIGRHRPIGTVTEERSANPISALKDLFSGSENTNIEENQNSILDELIEKGKVTPLESNAPITSNPRPNSQANNNTTSNGVRIDETNEPGGDFTPAGDNNRVIYDGEVVEIGHQYNPNAIGGDRRQGAGYGTYVVVRSSHPDYGKYDGLYAHFPGKNSIVVKVGDQVKRGDILGPMATEAQFGDPNMRPIVGSGTGPHTSLDFLQVGSNKKHPNWRELTRGINFNFGNEPKTQSNGGGYTPLSLDRDGAALEYVGDDLEFLEELTRVSKKFNIREGDLLGLMASESSLDPTNDNGEYVGLIQFSKDSAKLVGTTQSALLRMSRAEQMKYVEKYLEWWGLPRGADAGQIYSVVFAPSLASGDPNTVMYERGTGAYRANRWLDTNQDGVITVSELGGRIERKKKEYGISDVLGDPVQLQIEKNQRDREKFKNRPDLFFGTNISQGQKADNLQLASSMTEESMDGPMVALQVVYVKSDNFVVNNNKPKSSRGSANNFSEQYRMAVLGA
tara:strand:- start:8583 stop:11909 length:3327 start_codon:yes stop_codon:yes gene_type:complete